MASYLIYRRDTGELLYETDSAGRANFPVETYGRVTADADWRERFAWDAKAKALVARTPAPVPPRAFLQLFTPAERAAVRASADPMVQDVYAFTMAASVIEFDHPDTIGGLQLLLAKGLITQDRHDRIIAGLPPLGE